MVRTGFDVFLHEELRQIEKTKLGLVSNSAAVSENFAWIGDELLKQGAHLQCVFSPEHGLHAGGADATPMPTVYDERRKLWVHSLYGPQKEPQQEHLEEVELVLFDIPDIGARFYTYIWTLTYVMDACLKHGVPCWVLDRPNPITGCHLEGRGVEPSFATFEGRFSLPIRHGWTMGEIATWYNRTHLDSQLELRVIPAKGWTREQWWDQTGLPWISPSPAMATLETATIYPGTCLFEGTNVSEGRGTSHPFEWIGAAWIDEHALAKKLNAKNLPGVVFRPIQFIPWFDKLAEQLCRGVQVHVQSRNDFQPIRTGACILAAIAELHPDKLEWTQRDEKFWVDCLWGSDVLRKQIQESSSPLDEVCEMPTKASKEDFSRWQQFHMVEYGPHQGVSR